MSSFRIAWLISAVVIVGLSVFFAKRAEPPLGAWGILIDSRGRCSLTHFQVVMWTILILSTLIAVVVTNGFRPDSLSIPAELLGLMGISAGSAVLATGVKGAKDKSGANIARAGQFTQSNSQTRTIAARFAQIWLEEEGDYADQIINITKFQNFIFTLVAAAFYCVGAWKVQALPNLDEHVIWLLGISHAGYVGGKVPDKK